MIKIGVVNIDVSHPKTFSQTLSKENRAQYYALYNEGFRGPEEVEGFRKSAGLSRVCSSIEELAECCDVGFIQACNWDRHICQAMPFLEAGKPVFIDKPMAGSLRDCRRLLELERNGAVILGSSSVRYCDEITDFLSVPEQERGKLLHVSATVGVDEFNYAIHGAEGLCALTQAAPKTVRWVDTAQRDGQKYSCYFITFENGATATLHCVESRFMLFHFTVLTSRQDLSFVVDNGKLYGPMLREICNRLEGGPDRLASVEELIHPIRILLAGKLSRLRGGETVSVWDEGLEEVSFDGYAFEKEYAAAAKPMYL